MIQADIGAPYCVSCMPGGLRMISRSIRYFPDFNVRATVLLYAKQEL